MNENDVQEQQGLDEGSSPEVEHQSGGEDFRLAALERQQVLTTLMSDPEIRKVVEAKRAGKTPRVLLDDEVQPEPEPDPTDDFLKDIPEDDPTRKVLGTMDKIVAKRVESLVTQRVNEALSKLDPRLSQIENVAQEVQKREVVTQVNAAKTKYKDFDQYREAMVKLSKDNPTLGVEDLYVLAKHRSGKLLMAERSTFSERPTSQPRRSAGSPNGKPPARSPGKRGFNEILADALGQLDLNPESQE